MKERRATLAGLAHLRKCIPWGEKQGLNSKINCISACIIYMYVCIRAAYCWLPYIVGQNTYLYTYTGSCYFAYVTNVCCTRCVCVWVCVCKTGKGLRGVALKMSTLSRPCLKRLLIRDFLKWANPAKSPSARSGKPCTESHYNINKRREFPCSLKWKQFLFLCVKTGHISKGWLIEKQILLKQNVKIQISFFPSMRTHAHINV